MQINKLIEIVGEPYIQYPARKDVTAVYDSNDTWNRLQNAIPDFLAKYCGDGFDDAVKKEIEVKYMANLKKAIKKLEKRI